MGSSGIEALTRPTTLGGGKVEYDLGIGQPDSDPPPMVVKALAEAVPKGYFRYTSPMGVPELREALARFLNDLYGSDVRPEEVFVAPGAKGALFAAQAVLSESKRKLVLMDPSYYSYSRVGEFLGMEVIWVPMRLEDDRYRPDLEVLEKALDAESLLIINFPHNPTGSVPGRRIMDEIFDLVLDAGAKVLSDEAYEMFVYEGEHRGILSRDDWRRLGGYVGTLSKTLSVTGLRLGYAVLPEDLVRKMGGIGASIWGCPSAPSQFAALVSLGIAVEYGKALARKYDKRRRLALSILRKSDHLRVPVPEGALFLYPRLDVDSSRLSETLRERGLKVIPSEIFSPADRRSLRISFCVREKVLHDGLFLLLDTLDHL